LDLVEGRQRSRPTKRIEGEKTINCCVNRKDEGREINQEIWLPCANEATTLLGDMGAEAVEWNCQAQDVENVTDQDAFAIQGKNGSAANKHRNIGVVAHLDGKTRDWRVTDETWFVRDHVVSGSSISDSQLSVMERKDDWQKREVVEKLLKGWRQARLARL
jgi:hypothetical protein